VADGNVWVCPTCGETIPGGVVLVTGITGSDVASILRAVTQEAEAHKHPVLVHDIGDLMRQHAARDGQSSTEWARILNASPRVLRLLRSLAFKDVEEAIDHHPNCVHIIDVHLSFRWYAYLTAGFTPGLIRGLAPHVRLLVNIIQDLDKVKGYLARTAWGDRNLLELLLWRDEERMFTDFYAAVCDGKSYAVSAAEPASLIERLIWHPEMKRVYLSFPMTAIRDDEAANKEIETFRDEIREFLVVFDPKTCSDYDLTYVRADMKLVRREVGQTTIERDFRYIDQADAVVVYFPKKVPSDGVTAEMRYAFEAGKPVYHYCPEAYDHGPFQPVAGRTSNNRKEYVALLRQDLGAAGGGTK
jgi:nucleoside 2-deoxyribosyltransferase/adenylate kinase